MSAEIEAALDCPGCCSVHRDRVGTIDCHDVLRSALRASMERERALREENARLCGYENFAEMERECFSGPDPVEKTK